MAKKPRRPSKALLDRMTDEVSGFDAVAMAKFKREHGGMTPVQFALSHSPKERAEVAKAFPHLVAPKRRKPPPVGNR